MAFSRQEYWSGLPFPPPGDLPKLGIEPKSLVSPELAGRFFTNGATWEAHIIQVGILLHWGLCGPEPGNTIPQGQRVQAAFDKNSQTSPEKAMAPHSNTLAWKIPWTEEPGGL